MWSQPEPEEDRAQGDEDDVEILGKFELLAEIIGVLLHPLVLIRPGDGVDDLLYLAFVGAGGVGGDLGGEGHS